MLLGLTWHGWILALAGGFAAGLIYFGSIRLQAGCLVARGGGGWLMPLALVLRLVFLGAALYLAVSLVPPEAVAAALLSGLAGLLIARFLLIRPARSGGRVPGEPEGRAGPDGGGPGGGPGA
ncbi:MAG: ATP synthase subunit I [bacterium]